MVKPSTSITTPNQISHGSWSLLTKLSIACQRSSQKTALMSSLEVARLEAKLPKLSAPKESKARRDLNAIPHVPVLLLRGLRRLPCSKLGMTRMRLATLSKMCGETVPMGTVPILSGHMLQTPTRNQGTETLVAFKVPWNQVGVITVVFEQRLLPAIMLTASFSRQRIQMATWSWDRMPLTHQLVIRGLMKHLKSGHAFAVYLYLEGITRIASFLPMSRPLCRNLPRQTRFCQSMRNALTLPSTRVTRQPV
mmetsp:Transcript_24028/g.43441  ORF Transcript_24028/g.43441 Transcript_24028/m.43441 type:complete len:251 (+) Transcript_24028:534-1286(+)